MDLPLIDVSALVQDGPTDAQQAVAAQIDAACRHNGFFLITGHGIDAGGQAELDAAARRFFALPEAEKAAIAMERAGRRWRGWFPVGGELTSGVPDHKEGIYFGAELAADDPRALAGRVMHGPNLLPAEPPELGPLVLTWIEAMTALGHRLMVGIALALGLPPDQFRRELTADPTVLFRIFHYPPATERLGVPADRDWGVAEHTDYGLLTILAQDSSGGLEVRSGDDWVAVPAEPGAFVCNIGDMLDRMTGGRYRSTPHRVRSSAADRLSFPFFFDPSWDATVTPLPLDGPAPSDDAARRWDGTSVHGHEGTYGEYLSAKVARVFPQLATVVTEDR